MASLDVTPEAMGSVAASLEPWELVPEPPKAFEGELVKEITLPLNITREELEGRRKLKVRVTLEVNILP